MLPLCKYNQIHLFQEGEYFMRPRLTQRLPKLTQNLFLLAFSATLLLMSGCRQDQNRPLIIFPSGETIELEIAITAQEQMNGLSHRKIGDFPKNRGMLFYYDTPGLRQFWMPNTHFDLAIIFLDQDFKVLAYENPVPHHPSRQEPIPRTQRYWAHHVLEVRSDSPVVKELEKGIELKVKKLEYYLRR